MPLDWCKARWKVSSFSGDNGSCVAVARIGATIGVRDTKDPASPVLEFPRADEWSRFVQAVRNGEFDAP